MIDSPGLARRGLETQALVRQGHSPAEREGIGVDPPLDVAKGRPYGGEAWALRMASRLSLESTMRSRGRPRRESDI